jgi:hypothetical protein
VPSEQAFRHLMAMRRARHSFASENDMKQHCVRQRGLAAKRTRTHHSLQTTFVFASIRGSGTTLWLGGRLRSDQHVRLLDENVSKVPFTLLTALGGTAEAFGEGEGLVSSGIAELLA